MQEPDDAPWVDRELSWLSFNRRVLQEAMDPTVPLFERLTFLAIHSSNLDEFFRVRVASLRSLLRLKKKSQRKLDFNPSKLLREIHAEVAAQQEAFGEVFRAQILPELEEHGIHLVDERGVTAAQAAFLDDFFEREVLPELDPALIGVDGEAPFLEDRHVYLVTELWQDEGIGLADRPRYGLVEVPTPPLERFVAMPGADGNHDVMFLDDVIRLHLPALFPGFEVGSAYAVKLSRDADLYLEDEFPGNLVEAIRKSLSKRETGPPCRFLYDLQASYGLVSFLKECVRLENEDLVVGGRYHNLHDLADFPRFGMDHLAYPLREPLPHPELQGRDSVLDAVREKDRVLHLPYQSFGPVLRFLDEAARDPDVTDVAVTLYRVAGESEVAKALIRAAEAGKRVRAFVEVQARFDEALNLRWAERMEEAGVETLYGSAGLKVHAKMALVKRTEGGDSVAYAYLSTGNFNEKTACIYADHGVLTADRRITDDVERVFEHLAGDGVERDFDTLLVGPWTLREGFYERIDREIDHARAGRPAGMILKMNALSDPEIVHRLYEASRAGVSVDLIVRGICCLVPGVPGWSDTVRARSIVDAHLEHARVFLFRNGGEEEMWLASADWMHRNLSRRVEVAFPVLDPDVRGEIRTILDHQLADDVKARVIDERQTNPYVPRSGAVPVRAQWATRTWLRERAGKEPVPAGPRGRRRSASVSSTPGSP